MATKKPGKVRYKSVRTLEAPDTLIEQLLALIQSNFLGVLGIVIMILSALLLLASGTGQIPLLNQPIDQISRDRYFYVAIGLLILVVLIVFRVLWKLKTLPKKKNSKPVNVSPILYDVIEHLYSSKGPSGRIEIHELYRAFRDSSLLSSADYEKLVQKIIGVQK